MSPAEPVATLENAILLHNLNSIRNRHSVHRLRNIVINVMTLLMNQGRYFYPCLEFLFRSAEDDNFTGKLDCACFIGKNNIQIACIGLATWLKKFESGCRSYKHRKSVGCLKFWSIDSNLAFIAVIAENVWWTWTWWNELVELELDELEELELDKLENLSLMSLKSLNLKSLSLLNWTNLMQESGSALRSYWYKYRSTCWLPLKQVLSVQICIIKEAFNVIDNSW